MCEKEIEKIKEFLEAFEEGESEFERGVAYGIQQTIKMLGKAEAK
jgi:hypothetical protein